MEFEEIRKMTNSDVCKLSINDRIQTIERILLAAEMLVEELGRITLQEEPELQEQNYN